MNDHIGDVNNKVTLDEEKEREKSFEQFMKSPEATHNPSYYQKFHAHKTGWAGGIAFSKRDERELLDEAMRLLGQFSTDRDIDAAQWHADYKALKSKLDGKAGGDE